MAQNSYSAVGSGIVLPFNFATQGQFRIQSIEVDNGTAATLQLGPDTGGIFVTIPAYQTRIYSGINWGGYALVNQFGTTIQSTDILNVIASDQANTNNQASSYGPAAWGGGGVPNTLVPVLGGQGFYAWQVQQLIDLLTGVMSGQPVRINNTLRVIGVINAPGGIQAAFPIFSGLTSCQNLSADTYACPFPEDSGHLTDSLKELPFTVNGTQYWIKLFT